MKDPFSRFHNAGLVVTRRQTQETYRGDEKTGTTQLLSCRCDMQEAGKSLARARDVYETGDAIVFPEQSVTAVRPEDDVEVTSDDGRTITGVVEQVIPMSNSLLISL